MDVASKLDISVTSKEWKEAVPKYKIITQEALAAISDRITLAGKISLLLTNDKKIQKLNKDFRGKDKPTNVLSFTADEEDFLGDIAMSLNTLKREAKLEGKTLTDHFTHLFVHGVLHLLGYDHNTDDEQDEMENLEIAILKSLGIRNPY